MEYNSSIKYEIKLNYLIYSKKLIIIVIIIVNLLLTIVHLLLLARTNDSNNYNIQYVQPPLLIYNYIQYIYIFFYQIKLNYLYIQFKLHLFAPTLSCCSKKLIIIVNLLLTIVVHPVLLARTNDSNNYNIQYVQPPLLIYIIISNIYIYYLLSNKIELPLYTVQASPLCTHPVML
jgi:hypothetical protein